MLIDSESGGLVASVAESVAIIESTPIAADLALEVLTLAADMELKVLIHFHIAQIASHIHMQYLP